MDTKYSEHNGTTFVVMSQILNEWDDFFIHCSKMWQTTQSSYSTCIANKFLIESPNHRWACSKKQSIKTNLIIFHFISASLSHLIFVLISRLPRLRINHFHTHVPGLELSMSTAYLILVNQTPENANHSITWDGSCWKFPYWSQIPPYIWREELGINVENCHL